ncbi:signal recognition particle subunit SRP68-like [Pyrus ussuriensis x Pyrus communis]|uniref:Signal recognition particle subunit SRP68-like n=1 Tax=Pyrus ussuriensis x Pyrus communis TaxID=2448454 RepID=A0A5N5I0A0_9ROSA|nr:signal recognition particle subunit SRP68-like [Pyrus ussuriensis x Pyrus communis]
MVGFAEAMKVYNPMLQWRQYICNELAKTPFWSLLKMKRKSDMNLIKIINCYNPTTQKFKFGRHKAHGISSNYVVQNFGLNNEGIDMSNTDESTKFGDDDPLIKKYFADVKVKTLLDETPEGTQDIASLICAHLVESLLWDTSMIHKAIKDIPVEKIKNVNKHKEHTDEPENISINELFDEFKKARSIVEKRYITFREMMIKMLNNEKNSNALNAEMSKMQTKTTANTLKINDHLKQIGSLKKKLQEAQSRVAEMEPSQIPYLSASPQGLPNTLKDKKESTPTVEPMSNVVEMEVEKTLTTGLIIPIVEHVLTDVNEGKQSVTERKEDTRTLTKVEATQVQAAKVETKGELPLKACVKSSLKKATKNITKGETKSKCPSSTKTYKLLNQEIKEKIKEYYRQCQLSMATELVLLRSDLTSLFVDGPIDAKLIDVFSYIMLENEMKEGKEQSLYLSSYIFNDMEIKRPKSDDEYLDQCLKTILEENVDKVGKVFILMKHYFHFTLIV